MARKHGFFRPHVAGLSGIYSTTLREGVGAPSGYGFLIAMDSGGNYRRLLALNGAAIYRPIYYKKDV